MKRIICLPLLILSIMGCKKPYDPPATSSPGTYLVVEGTINAAGVTTINLSHTVNLSSAKTPNVVTGAAVSIISSQNNTAYSLSETAAGTYVSGSLNLSSSFKYRLSIKTPDNQQYLSAFESVQVSPPIDSIGFTPQGMALQIYVNTHDPSNLVKYYRWDYTETWQFHSEYESSWISDGKEIVPRTPAQQIYHCFSSDTSSDIVLGSTARLSQDIVYQSPVTLIPSTSEKIETRYSILINQYALTGDAYTFWSTLRTDTEQLGSIFDAQPSNLNGNIQCVNNPAEPVIGYISVCTVTSKRIFIDNSQLPQSWSPTYPYTCQLDSEYYCSIPYCYNQVAQSLIPLPNSFIPAQAFYLKGSPSIGGFMASDIQCVDCTIRGKTAPPPFWK